MKEMMEEAKNRKKNWFENIHPSILYGHWRHFQLRLGERRATGRQYSTGPTYKDKQPLNRTFTPTGESPVKPLGFNLSL